MLKQRSYLSGRLINMQMLVGKSRNERSAVAWPCKMNMRTKCLWNRCVKAFLCQFLFLLRIFFNDNRTLQFETVLLWIDAEMRLIISFRFWFCYFYHINYQITTSNCQTKTTSTTTGLLKTGILKMVQCELGIQLAAVTVPEVPHATICLEHLLFGPLCFFLLLFFHNCDQLRRGKQQQKTEFL